MCDRSAALPLAADTFCCEVLPEGGPRLRVPNNECPLLAPCPIRAQKNEQQRSGTASEDHPNLMRLGQACRSE